MGKDRLYQALSAAVAGMEALFTIMHTDAGWQAVHTGKFKPHSASLSAATRLADED